MSQAEQPHKIKVMLIDDDAAMLGLMEDALAHAGRYEIRGTTSGTEALSVLGQETFDIVVSDLALNEEDIDGMKILEFVRDNSPRTLGIIITAYATLEVSLKAIQLGAYDFLAKPFQIDELLLKIANAADRVTLEAENSQLRTAVEEMVGSIDALTLDQKDLAEKVRGLAESSVTGADGVPAIAAASGYGAHFSQQIQSYGRSAETLGERLNRENDRLEELFEQGLISEPVYRRGLDLRMSA